MAHEFGQLNGAVLRMGWEAVIARDVSGFREALLEARALMATAEFELEATAQGAAFFSTLRKSAGDLLPLDWAERQLAGMAGPIPYPFAVGIAAASVDAPLELALVAFFQALIGNVVSAGLRLLPLGQTAGQRIVARLQEPVIALARDVMARCPGDIGTAAPIMEWSSICHETQYTRLFRS
jgi:urease accessory protein